MITLYFRILVIFRRVIMLFQWLSICKWQLLFERSVIARDLKSAEEAIDYLKLYDKEDAKFRYVFSTMISRSHRQ